MAEASSRTTLRILPVVAFTFIAYFSIGAPLAVLPTYLHLKLGLSTTLAGLLVSLQYIGTFITRPIAGHFSDTRGPRRSVLTGLVLGGSAGVLLLMSSLLAHTVWLMFAVLALSRLALGVAESFTSTGAIMWGIGRVGTENTSQVISWNGVATYGALAIGAPFGSLLASRFGIGSVGVLIVVIGVIGWFSAAAMEEVAVSKHEESGSSAGRLFGVAPFGVSLALSGMAFGVIASFTGLFFAQNGWEGAPLALTFYGFAFVFTRLTLSGLINKVGGFRTALISMAVETVGIVLLGYAHTPHQAYMGCAVAGFGFSLVFPALAVELIQRFPKNVHGSVLGIYSAFIDLTLFLAGPTAGFAILHAGYRGLYHYTAAATLLALILTAALQRREANVTGLQVE